MLNSNLSSRKSCLTSTDNWFKLFLDTYKYTKISNQTLAQINKVEKLQIDMSMKNCYDIPR